MATDGAAVMADGLSAPAKPYLWKRHALTTRITHWITVLSMAFLLATGLNIFNAHPALYWGSYGADADDDKRWLEIGSTGQQGITRIGPVKLDTTGVLGLSNDKRGQAQAIGFPGWATFPSYRDLGTARNWHFFFAWVFILNGLVYLAAGLWSGHLKRDLLPRLSELSPRNILHDIWLHLRLKFPRGEDAKRYHILQKAAYGGTVFILLPLMVASGLSLSPGIGASWTWLIDLLGGRQSARSIHFITMALLVGFVIVHVAMVLLAGPFNEIRSMITGKFRIDPVKP